MISENTFSKNPADRQVYFPLSLDHDELMAMLRHAKITTRELCDKMNDGKLVAQDFEQIEVGQKVVIDCVGFAGLVGIVIYKQFDGWLIVECVDGVRRYFRGDNIKLYRFAKDDGLFT